MPRFLHVGCGTRPKEATTPVFAGAEWEELRVDIDPGVQPHIIASMTDMAAVATGSMDAVFAHHTLEHLFIHEVPVALAEFRRVLRPDGFAIIAVPDLQGVAALVAEGKLMEAAYVSPAGPICPHDSLYGLGAAIARGHHYMAHRCGFTGASLTEFLRRAGFATVMARRHAVLQLTCYARVEATPEAEIVAWAQTHFIPA